MNITMNIMANFKSKDIQFSKHKIIDGLAYTGDSILVYNIFIHNLPKEATKENLTEYFHKFGEVLNVGLLENCGSKDCFVNFADPKVAAKVLQREDHILLNCHPLVVQPSHSCYQPSGKRLLELLSDNFKNDSISDNACSISPALPHLEQNALIFTLNDDCLEHICKKLTLNDQINFALTCQRFCDIFKMISHVKYVDLNTNIFTNLSQFKIIVFVLLVGPQMQSLVIDIRYAAYNNTVLKILKFLCKFCTNVEKLKINAHFLPVNNIPAIISQMPMLQELELDIDDINVAFIKFLKTFKNLKFLIINDNFDITGENIHILSGLEKLSLYGCRFIKPLHFKEICINLKNLHYLDITACKLLKTEDFEHISRYLLQLETLKISTTSQNINSITLLPKLKHLEVKDYYQIYLQVQFFRDLAQYQVETLQELKLADLQCFNTEMATLVAELKNLKQLYCSGHDVDDESLKTFSQINALEDLNVPKCPNISDKGVVQLLERAVKLKRVNLSNCESLTPDLIRNVFKLLLNQRARYLRTERLHITLASPNDGFECVINYRYIEEYKMDIMANFKNPKHKIIDGLAYTEDSILVYNIFIRNLPKVEIDLEKYSDVLKITLKECDFVSYINDYDYSDEYDSDDFDYDYYDAL